jgi:hypothetical protein
MFYSVRHAYATDMAQGVSISESHELRIQLEAIQSASTSDEIYSTELMPQCLENIAPRW